MALPATDDFNRAALGTNWTVINGGFAIVSSTVIAVASGQGESGMGWNVDAANNDQYSQLTITARVNYKYLGPGARVNASTANYYFYYAGLDDRMLGKIVAGAWTWLGGAGAGAAVNDVLRIEASGTTLTCKRNGSNDFSPVTDTSHASGRVGVTGYDGTTTQGDTWEGGNLGGAATSIAFAPAARRLIPHLIR